MPLYVVSTPIGNLGDITLRAVDVLSAADVTYAEDTRHTRRLFERHDIDTPLRSLHEHNERSRVSEVLERLERGDAVALVSDAGTPLVSDPGFHLVRAAKDAGHEVLPLPGPSAVLAALVVSGAPTDRYTFLGFMPRKGKARSDVLRRIERSAETVVLFEAPGRVSPLLQDLSGLLSDERRIAVARELTKLHETVFRGTVSEALAHFIDKPPKGEVTVVIDPGVDEQAEMPTSEEVARFARDQLEAGRSRSDAVDSLRERFGIRRNEAYRIVHDLAD